MLLAAFILMPNAPNVYWAIVGFGLATFQRQRVFWRRHAGIAAGRARSYAILRSHRAVFLFHRSFIYRCHDAFLVALITDHIFKDPRRGSLLHDNCLSSVIAASAWLILWFARPAYLECAACEVSRPQLFAPLIPREMPT